MRAGLLLLFSLLLSSSLGAGTLTVANMGKKAVDVVWARVEPGAGTPRVLHLEPEQSVDTKQVVAKGELYSFAFERDRVQVAAPVIAEEPAMVFLLEPNGGRAYVVVRPPYESRNWTDVGDAINLGGGARPSTLFCIPIDVRTWRGKQVAVLANGSLLELVDRTGEPPLGDGRHCVCGRAIAAAKDAPFERFEAGSTRDCPR